MDEHIVMIHGMWCGDWVWSNYRKFFEAKGFHCITPTLRYHDRSTKETNRGPVSTTSLLDYAQDLEEEICRLDQRPVIMGHSMGGLLAQILGSRGLAKALVLLTPASPRGVLALTPSVVRSFWSNLSKPGFWHRPMMPTFREAAYSMLHLLPAEEQMEIYTSLVPESGRAGFEIGFWIMDPKKAAQVETPRITCPMLIVSGVQDRITPSSVVRSVADKYRDVATLVEYPNHAHWVLGEPGWYEIAENCSDWLERVLARRSRRPSAHTTGAVRFSVRAGKVISEYRGRWFPAQRGDRRVYERRDAVLGVDAGIPYSGNGQYYELGKTLNLSSGGMFLEGDMPLREGTYINADLHLTETGKPLWVQGRIVRSTGRGMAVAFSHVEQGMNSRLTASL